MDASFDKSKTELVIRKISDASRAKLAEASEITSLIIVDFRKNQPQLDISHCHRLTLLEMHEPSVASMPETVKHLDLCMDHAVPIVCAMLPRLDSLSLGIATYQKKDWLAECEQSNFDIMNVERLHFHNPRDALKLLDIYDTLPSIMSINHWMKDTLNHVKIEQLLSRGVRILTVRDGTLFLRGRESVDEATVFLKRIRAQDGNLPEDHIIGGIDLRFRVNLKKDTSSFRLLLAAYSVETDYSAPCFLHRHSYPNRGNVSGIVSTYTVYNDFRNGSASANEHCSNYNPSGERD